MISANDRKRLRELAKRVAEIADLPVMAERRKMWKQHNSLMRVRPMILVFPEGSWRELVDWSSLQCEGEKARNIEGQLLMTIYHYEHIHDDAVIEKSWTVRKRIWDTGWGLKAKERPSSQSTGAWGFDPVIHKAEDLKKLKYPVVHYDEKGSLEDLEKIQDLFGDILNIKFKGIAHISFHLMALYCKWRGLEQVMWDMYDNPNMLHDAMSFLEEGHRQLVQQYIDYNLLSLNNDETYHSSGGNGYTDELPQKDFNPERVRPCDMWSSAEAQEMAQVSPEMHREFILDYEKRLLEPFGLNGYGCCEDLSNKLDDVLTIPNIRRISISPWADVEKCADKIKGKCIFSWKPNPAYLVGEFNKEKIRENIKHTLDATRDCVIEMILKDTHTCENHPERFTMWTDIAQELAADY